jgi:heavy metal efflux system protein
VFVETSPSPEKRIVMGRLIASLLKHRAIVLFLLSVFVIAGVNAYMRLPVEAFPDMTNIQVQIITLYPGHAAEEVEKLATIPVENEMNGIPKRVSMRSVSLFGLSVVTIVFEDDAQNDYVRSQAFQHLSAVKLPDGAEASLSPDATPIGEIFRYTLRAVHGYPEIELKAIEDWVVERKLRTVPGVVDVVGFGGPAKQYQVLVDPSKLRGYDLSLKQVLDALANGNLNAGGSYVEHGSEMYVVRGLGFIRGPSDISAISVVTRNGTPIRIGDIGSVVVGERLRLGRVGRFTPGGADEDDVAEGIVLMRRGENPVSVLEHLHAKVAEINQQWLPVGVKMVPYYDRTELVHRTLSTVRKNMAEGIGLVLLVLVVFLGLGNYRSALIVATVVPLSLLGAFLLLDLKGVPANLISMGAIDFGIIVDSAVVIIENVLRLVEEQREKGNVTPLLRTIVDATTEMGRPILFSKAILLAAFIPLYTLQRVEGKIFLPMALTLTFALVAGTLFAFALVPVLASFLSHGKIAGGESAPVQWLVAHYRTAIAFTLERRWAAAAGAAVVLAIGGVSFVAVGSEFLPKLDEGALWVRVFMPQSIAPTEAMQITRDVRRRLAGFPEVVNVVSQLGRPDDGTDVNGFNVAEFSVALKLRDQWTTATTRDELSDAMGKKLAEIPGIETQFSQYIEDNVNEAVSGIKSELAIKLFGEDPEKLQDLSERIADVIRRVPGSKDVGTDKLLGQPQIQIAVDRAAIARYGLTVADVEGVIATAMSGAVATQVLEGERTFDLVVKLTPRAVSDIDSIRNIPVFGPSGEHLTLGSVASVEVHPGLARILREENARRVAIKLSVRGRDLGSLVAEAQAKVAAAVKLPPGYRLEWTGAFENQKRAEGRMALIAPITLLTIFFLLFIAFDSGRLALLILLNVPYAAAGGLCALFATRLNLSVSALVGFVALFGISIQNRVILVSRIRDLRAQGMTMGEAVVEGATSRVRPMVMTALMAMLGLLPAALSHAVGAETARPFAVVIIGGLLTDTVMTLFIVPVLYRWFEPKPRQDASEAAAGYALVRPSQ